MESNLVSASPGQLEVSLGDTTLVLLANRMAWWPDQRILFLADSHFGKAATFRKHGLPVPTGTTASMLSTITSAIESFNPSRLIVLGDLIHSSVKAETDYQDDLLSWRQAHNDLEICLVRGNHDRHNRRFIASMSLDVVDEGHEIGSLVLMHNSEGADLEPKDKFILSGHIHPSVRLKDRSMSGLKAACFWQKANELVFPAFGQFTGTAVVSPDREDTVYPIAGDGIFRVSGRNCG